MFSGSFPFNPLRVKLLAGDLRAAQKRRGLYRGCSATNIGLVGGYLEDTFPLQGTLCQVPC